MPSTLDDVKKFVEPKSVAIFGVSRRAGDGAFNILEQLLHQGYEGEIYPVNPNAAEILGVKTYPSIREVNHNGIDLGVINLPRHLVPGVVGECADAGIRNIVISTQGFADANDKEGKQLQEQIDSFVKQGRVRILGPNSLGTANPHLKFTSSFMPLRMREIPIGVICQSGIFFGFPERTLLGKGIDVANSCDIGFPEALEYYEQDPQTRVIVVHIEGTRDSQRFISTASRVARRKPVLVLKTARTEQAAIAAASHTGSLVGSEAVWDVALRQAGIIRIDSSSELADVPEFFALMPLMKGRKVAIVTVSGGFGVISIDACVRNGLQVASLSAATLGLIQALNPAWQHAGNPIDYVPPFLVMKHPYRKVVAGSLKAALADDTVDAVIFLAGAASHAFYHRLCDIMDEAVPGKPPKPMACCIFGEHRAEAKHALESAGKAVCFESPEAAAKALAYLARYSELRRGFQDNPGVDR